MLIACGSMYDMSKYNVSCIDRYTTLCVQDCMRQAVNGVGGLSHEEWRSFSSERKKGECKNFIDGDLIEQFADLKRDTMQWVVDRMGNGVTIEELSKTVEELSRLH